MAILKLALIYNNNNISEDESEEKDSESEDKMPILENNILEKRNEMNKKYCPFFLHSTRIICIKNHIKTRLSVLKTQRKSSHFNLH